MPKKLTTEEFIEKAKQIHGDKYDYSKVKYINNSTKVCIICPMHGEFFITPRDHLSNHGCSYCGKSHKYTTEEFIKKAKQIHGDKYDYSKIEYINSHTKICITCNKHGDFFQMPYCHILLKHGCPLCKKSHLENILFITLSQKGIDFEYEKKFDWLGRQSLDFYLPKYSIAIECQGKQHFGIGGWSSINEKNAKEFKLIQERDERKYQLCEENGIKLLYFSNKNYPNYKHKLFIDKIELLNEILNNET